MFITSLHRLRLIWQLTRFFKTTTFDLRLKETFFKERPPDQRRRTKTARDRYGKSGVFVPSAIMADIYPLIVDAPGTLLSNGQSIYHFNTVDWPPISAKASAVDTVKRYREDFCWQWRKLHLISKFFSHIANLHSLKVQIIDPGPRE
jgi:hypothetical protein